MFIESIKAKKSLGQNFLVDEEALSDIAESIEVVGKHIIEVGPGYGALTDYLIAKNPKSLDLVELDKDMIALLKDKFGVNDENGVWIKIHHTDILRFAPPHEQYSVIANIPYYITSPILFHFLYPENAPLEKSQKQEVRGEIIFSKEAYSDVSDWENNFLNDEVRRFSGFSPPEEMVIMMQKEVWEKILEWRARKPHHSLLSLAMEQACEDIEMVRYVGRESFRPAPKVDSIVLKFIVKMNRNREEENALIKLWEKSFTHPRKTLISNLKWYYDIEIIKSWLNKCGYDDKVRAEAVKREDWKGLIL